MIFGVEKTVKQCSEKIAQKQKKKNRKSEQVRLTLISGGFSGWVNSLFFILFSKKTQKEKKKNAIQPTKIKKLPIC